MAEKRAVPGAAAGGVFPGRLGAALDGAPEPARRKRTLGTGRPTLGRHPRSRRRRHDCGRDPFCPPRRRGDRGGRGQCRRHRGRSGARRRPGSDRSPGPGVPTEPRTRGGRRGSSCSFSTPTAGCRGTPANRYGRCSGGLGSSAGGSPQRIEAGGVLLRIGARGSNRLGALASAPLRGPGHLHPAGHLPESRGISRDPIMEDAGFARRLRRAGRIEPASSAVTHRRGTLGTPRPGSHMPCSDQLALAAWLVGGSRPLDRTDLPPAAAGSRKPGPERTIRGARGPLTPRPSMAASRAALAPRPAESSSRRPAEGVAPRLGQPPGPDGPRRLRPVARTRPEGAAGRFPGTPRPRSQPHSRSPPPRRRAAAHGRDAGRRPVTMGPIASAPPRRCSSL